jgi:hypothetical protein
MRDMLGLGQRPNLYQAGPMAYKYVHVIPFCFCGTLNFVDFYLYKKSYNILDKSKIINPKRYAGIHRYRNISFQTLNRNDYRNGIDKLDGFACLVLRTWWHGAWRHACMQRGYGH